MRLTVVAVGRLKAGPERELFARYVERVGALAAHVGISGVDWREVAEGRAGRLGTRLMAIVAEGQRNRVYLSPTEAQERTARTTDSADVSGLEHFQNFPNHEGFQYYRPIPI